MSHLFKALLSIFLITLGAAIIYGIIAADADAGRAKEYKNNVINEIECSNMSQSVINSCIDTASNNTEYTLIVNPITDDAGKTVMCEVVLNYNFKVPILHINTAHQTRGFAR